MTGDVTDRDRKRDDGIVTFSDHIGGRVAVAFCDEGEVVRVYHSCNNDRTKTHSLTKTNIIYAASHWQTGCWCKWVGTIINQLSELE